MRAATTTIERQRVRLRVHCSWSSTVGRANERENNELTMTAVAATTPHDRNNNPSRPPRNNALHERSLPSAATIDAEYG